MGFGEDGSVKSLAVAMMTSSCVAESILQWWGKEVDEKSLFSDSLQILIFCLLVHSLGSGTLSSSSRSSSRSLSPWSTCSWHH